MKLRFVKSALCLTLAGALAFGDVGIAWAAETGTEATAVEEQQMETTKTEGVVGEEATEPEEVVEEEVAVPEEVVEDEVVVPKEEVEDATVEETVTVETESEDVVEDVAVEEDIDVLGGKIVSYKTLTQVTGIGYDSTNKRLYWNKVANATYYYLSLKNITTGNTYSRGTSYTYYDYMSNYLDGNYTVSIYAVNMEDYYLWIANATSEQFYNSEWDNYTYTDASQTKYNLYKHPTGPAGTGTFTISSPKVSITTISALSGIKQREVTEYTVVFEMVNPPSLNVDEEVRWEYSNNASFKDDNGANFKTTVYMSDAKETLDISLSNFLPGETCYVRARVYNKNYNNYAGGYSAYTKTVTYKIPAAVIGGVNTSVSATSITLSPALKSGTATATGYEYAKKVGSKWASLGAQNSESYKETGLSKNTKYQYRVRGYFYNKNTKKTTYTSWYYVDATTWGANLNLKASAASTTSAKLNWSKVASAEGYEVYRMNTSSYADTRSNGEYMNNFASYTLVKTIKKAATISYTDKKLQTGKSYAYIVRAYRTINKQKCYIDDSAYVNLKATSLTLTRQYYISAGKYVVNWDKMTGIKGYKVEQKNNTTGNWTVVKTLKSNATSYTAAKVAVGKENVTYRIRPYDASRNYTGSSFTVSPQLAAVKNVKAAKTSEGIKVSWSKVSGADYYRVYRTTDSSLTYNKTTKTYSYGGTLVYDSAANTDNCDVSISGGIRNEVGTYRLSDITANSVVDKTVTYKVRATDGNGKEIQTGTLANGTPVYQTEDYVYNQGPEAGVTYYYYVIAYAKAANGKSGSSTISSVGCTKPASAMYTSKTAKKVSKISTAKSKKKTQATITYKKASGASGYAIYRSTSKNGTYRLVGTTTKTSYTDTGLISGKTYYYKVASYVKSESKSNIYSAQTAAKSVKAK